MSDSGTAEAAAIDRDTFVERVLQDASGVFSLYSMYMGERLGLYHALRDSGPATSVELAGRTGTQERYIREWLEQQAVISILKVDDETLPAAQRRYNLPAGRSEALTDRQSANYIAPLLRAIVGAASPVTAVLEAYRNGGGVPFDAYGADMREGQAAGNRWSFLNQLSQEWLPVMGDVHSRLQADPPAKVADIGCGFGWSSIGLALGYPKIHVDGFDLDEPSIERARENAAEEGVSDRVSFAVRDAGDPTLAGQYDLVTAFECVHDMADPVSALRVMGQLTTENGSVFIMDERVGESFTAAGTGFEWSMYGWSILHCLPVGMIGENAVGTGTVMRPGTLRSYALQAGFRDVEILPIDHFFFRFYRLIK